MAQSVLTINLKSIADNWRSLDKLSGPDVETGAVLKANSYGLGISMVAPYLANQGVSTFFVALAEEGREIRQLLPDNVRIFILSGYMRDDIHLIKQFDLIPILVSQEQFIRYSEDIPDHKFGLQLDTGMNRLGMEPEHFLAQKDNICNLNPELIISHLSWAEERDHAMNNIQLNNFRDLTQGLDAPLSLSATGGISLGKDFHFDLCRPGIGLFGGLPFEEALPVVSLEIPLIQTQNVVKGEGVGYNTAWIAKRDTTLATIAAGYADGLIRSLSNNSIVYANGIPCPVVGRVSMDLITVDITDLEMVPDYFEMLGANQTINELAEQASTISHEILTSLGQRYYRSYVL